MSVLDDGIPFRSADAGTSSGDPSSGVRGIIEDAAERVAAQRHDLHRHPELMFEEHRTADVIRETLEEFDVSFGDGFAGGTGIVAHLPATEDGHVDCVGLRTDMDALPIRESTGRPYASAEDGVMHACGHDGHMAIVLGAVRVLSGLRKRPQHVTFVFQPGEEGGGGGKLMCEEGALSGDEDRGIGAAVDRLYGLHGWPDLPLGTIGTRPGPLMAAANRFRVTIRGRGGHAAMPERTRDPIVAASAAITGLQSLVSRNVDPLDAGVVSVGQIHGGEAFNVIPDEVTMSGTTRAFDDAVHDRLQARVDEVVKHTAIAYGCEGRIEWDEGFPVTANAPDLADRVLAAAGVAFGEERAVTLQRPTMTAEDFGFYGGAVPTCFFFLGLQPENGGVAALHQSDFDFPDAALPVGVEMMVRLALAG